MMFPSKKIVDNIKNKYTKGSRVQLVKLNDEYRYIPKGTLGTVIGVDDCGTIHVSWDNHCSLGIVYGVDSCELLPPPKKCK